MAAQVIPREGLQLYSLGDGPLPTQGPTTLYTRNPKSPQYNNSLTLVYCLLQKLLSSPINGGETYSYSLIRLTL
jgi:hypothetical protein